ncbi:MAG TPA: hypothetical protein VF384_06495 [Planctomycetota bacterium]
MRDLFAALLASVASAQTTWIVDDTAGPGVHFTSLPAAVAAAASGDTLLVAPGNYAAFHVSGKALSILGDGNATTIIDGPPVSTSADYVIIAAPPVGTTFRLSGFTIRRGLASGSRLGISGVAGVPWTGTVVLTDVISEPLSVAFGGGAEQGLGVTGIAVHASRCVFRGSWVYVPVFSPNAFGFHGARVNAGLFVADACSIHGGSPSPAGGAQSITAGDGLSVSNSTVHLTGCTVSGGSTGSANSALAGAGMRVSGSTARVYGSAANSIRGGNVIFTGTAGPGIEVAGGTVSVFGPVVVAGGVSPSGTAPATIGPVQIVPRPWPVLSLTGSAPNGGDLQPGQPVTLSLTAPTMPSHLFGLVVDLAPGFFALPGISPEPGLLSGAATLLLAGVLDAAGQFAVTFTPATQAPSTTNHPFHLQGFVLDPTLGLWLGSNAEVRRIR